MEDKDLNMAQAPQEPNQDTSYDATLEDDMPKMSEAELQDSILEDSDLNGFQKWVARTSDAKWKLYQRILGIALGLGAGVALFWDGLFGKVEAAGKQGFSYSLIIAVVIAMVVPNIVEKQGRRKIPVARMTMAITLGVVLVGYFIWVMARGGLKS